MVEENVKRSSSAKTAFTIVTDIYEDVNGVISEATVFMVS